VAHVTNGGIIGNQVYACVHGYQLQVHFLVLKGN